MSTTPTFFRSDQARIDVTVEGVSIDNISWDSMEGGENEVQGLEILPGGMAPQVALGGIPKRKAVTIQRVWTDTLINIYKSLDAVAGNAAVTASYTVLGTNKKPAFPPITYQGVLGTVSRPNYKAGTSEEAFLSIMVDLNGEVS